MTTLQHFRHDGWRVDDVRDGAEVAAALRHIGIETGRWPLQLRPVSSTPQLTYARELHALQRRFGIAMTDRLRWPLRHPRAEAARPDTEIAEVHVHDDTEVRVVLSGHARFVVAPGQARGWTLIDCEPGSWIALPAGLPHALVPSAADPVDLLRLFAHRRAWVARRTDAGLPPTALSRQGTMALAA